VTRRTRVNSSPTSKRKAAIRPTSTRTWTLLPAVPAAPDRLGRAQEFRRRWDQKGIALGVTRIGAHAGPALVGNFGGERFFDYTAYGDTINVTSRLETANKQLGTRMCVSATLARKVPDFHGRPVGALVLRGRTEPSRSFEPLSGARNENEAISSYLGAFVKLEVNDPGALAAFAAHVGKYPDDHLAGFHLKRLLNGATGTRILMD
jgi:adenylate cyclase